MAGGQLKLEDGASTGHYAGIKAPDGSIASDVVWSLPSTDGTAGQVLSTDGSLNLTWDSSLRNDLNSEITSRQNSELSEVTARMNSDSTLTTNLNSEITSRMNSDSTLTANLNSEITSRLNSDSTLTANLNSEMTSRLNADSSLQANLNSEITSRMNSDSTLQSSLTSGMRTVVKDGYTIFVDDAIIFNIPNTGGGSASLWRLTFDLAYGSAAVEINYVGYVNGSYPAAVYKKLAYCNNSNAGVYALVPGWPDYYNYDQIGTSSGTRYIDFLISDVLGNGIAYASANIRVSGRSQNASSSPTVFGGISLTRL